MSKIVGFTAGAWDLLHAGHCKLLQDCKNHCDYLIVGLHVDPSIERCEKNSPIQTLEERIIQLESNRDVDLVQIYETEAELRYILESNDIDIRFIGSDYLNRKEDITAYDLNIPIFFHSRNHSYSSSELRHRIYVAEINRTMPKMEKE